MPGTGLSQVLPLLLLGLVLVAGSAGVDRALRTRDSEGLFWVGLAAFLGVLLTAAWVVAAAPEGSVAAGLVLVGGSAAAGGWVLKRDRRRRLRKNHQQVQAALHSTAARHRDVVARWSAYELDPWLAAEHPQLLDVRVPETREFIRALKDAEQLRPERGSMGDPAAYAEAVGRLEQTLRRAEEAAGRGRAV